ncbi:MAG TPA: TonB-dependent receptor [Candidatus Acidoferrales bacterium]|nr:TonB-dependent receptor [Candidatus Acidoferrales bacterium]
MNTKHLLRLFLIVTFLASTLARAQAQTTGAITGTVRDAGGKPIAGATVSIRPASVARVESDAQGAFTLANVPAGTYDLTVSKGGFVEWMYAGIAVPGTKPVTVTLVARSLDTLKQIASVQTSAGSSFNTTATATQTLTQQSFVDQGQINIGHVLDEIPGVISNRPDSGNGGAPGSITSPNLRGAFDWEKSNLIDGFPLIAGKSGDYDTPLVNSLLFNDVEIIKGPTAYANEINYGIGGTINFVTGEPSLTPHDTLIAGIDNQQGAFAEMRISDTIGKVGYLVALVRSGTNGPLDDYATYVTLPSGSKVNGVSASSTLSSSAPTGYGGPYPVPGSIKGSNPSAAYTTLVACCQDVTSTYQSNGELAKLAYHFSSATTLTLGYVGIQGEYNGPAASLTQIYSTFTPGLSYDASGSPFANGGQFLLNQSAVLPNQNLNDNEPMFEGQFRTALGNDTFLARWYSAVLERPTYSDLSNPASSYTLPLQLWGTVKLAGTATTFNGQSEQVTVPDTSAYVSSMGDFDHLRGGSFEYDHPIGSNNLLTAAYDADTSLTQSYKIAPGSGAVQYSIAPGTRQDMDNWLLRDVVQIGDKAQLTLANYYNVYRSTYAPTAPSDTSFDFSTTTSTHDDPRLGFVYRPDENLSLRFSAGSSIAPPYPSLIDNNTETAEEVLAGGGAVGTTVTVPVNSGTLRPETAFAYDIGGDARLRRNDILSVDLYLTNIWNQFLTQITDTGTTYTYNGTPYEVYTSTNGNLAQSRDEGIEIGLHHDPAVGYGFTVSGDLARAYAYNVPGNFYSTAAGQYETNLGVIPGINYISNGSGYNNISNKSEPYSMGYAEIHRRGSWGQYASLGLTYYGSNNMFNIPAYFVGHATLRQPVAPHTALQISVDNLFGSNALPYVLYGVNSGAIYAPLATGQVGLKADVPYGPTTLRVLLVRSI